MTRPDQLSLVYFLVFTNDDPRVLRSTVLVHGPRPFMLAAESSRGRALPLVDGRRMAHDLARWRSCGPRTSVLAALATKVSRQRLDSTHVVSNMAVFASGAVHWEALACDLKRVVRAEPTPRYDEPAAAAWPQRVGTFPRVQPPRLLEPGAGHPDHHSHQRVVLPGERLLHALLDTVKTAIHSRAELPDALLRVVQSRTDLLQNAPGTQFLGSGCPGTASSTGGALPYGGRELGYMRCCLAYVFQEFRRLKVHRATRARY